MQSACGGEGGGGELHQENCRQEQEVTWQEDGKGKLQWQVDRKGYVAMANCQVDGNI